MPSERELRRSGRRTVPIFMGVGGVGAPIMLHPDHMEDVVNSLCLTRGDGSVGVRHSERKKEQLIVIENTINRQAKDRRVLKEAQKHLEEALDIIQAEQGVLDKMKVDSDGLGESLRNQDLFLRAFKEAGLACKK